MTLRVNALLTANARQAKSEVDGFRGSLDRAGDQIDEVARSGTRATGALGRFRSTVSASTAGLRDWVRGVGQADKTQTMAAGSVGNLVAQFNDIGVMLAAGQNPLQLAIQQGTQITQVFRGMGAAGAVRALGAAFRSMVSPINLITIGAIAAGAALTNWLTRGTQDADEMADALDAAVEKVADLRRERDLMRGGFASAEELALTEAVTQAERALADAVENTGRLRGGSRQAAIEQAREELDLARENLLLLREQETRNDAVRAANAATFDDILRSYRDNRSALQDTLGDLTQQNSLLDVARRFGEDSAEATRARAQAERDALEATLATVPGHEDVKDAIRAALEEQIALNTAIGAADLSGLSGQAQALAGQMGFAADEAERYNAALNIAAGLQARETAPSAGGDRGLGFGIDGAADDGTLGVGFSNLGFGDLSGGPTGAVPRARVDRTPARAPRRRASGGARAATEERDAVQDLLDGYDRRLAILRETDPVQQELLRNAEAISDATEAQIAAARGKIAALQREETLQGRITDLADFAGSQTMALFDAFRSGGDAAADAWRRVGDAILDALAQAALMGDGPLGSIFGGGLIPSLFGAATGGGGGLLSGLLGGLFGRADGGPIYGSGGPREDRQLIKASPGEFVVNARATSRNRALLEAINAGSPLPGFADGGPVGAGRTAGLNVEFNPVFRDATRGGVQMQRVDDEIGPAGRRLPVFELSDAVDGAINQRGGAAARTLNARGVQPPRPRR